jgi:hypothetical protein
LGLERGAIGLSGPAAEILHVESHGCV